MIIVSAVPVTVTGISVNTAPANTVYYEGESLDLSGLVVNITKSDSTVEVIDFSAFDSNGLSTDPANSTVLSTENGTVTIIHTSGLSTSQSITVNTVAVTGISVNTAPANTVYYEGESLDLSGLVVNITKSDSTVEVIDFSAFDSNGLSTDPANSTALSTENSTVTIIHTSGLSTSQSITVNTVAVTGISVNTAPTNTVYYEGDSLDLSGLVVNITKSDSTVEEIEFSAFDSNGLSTDPGNGTVLSTEDGTVTISHTSGLGTSQLITVNAVSTTTSTSGSGGGGGGSLSSGEKYENIAFKDYVLKAVVKDTETVFSFYKEDNSIVSVSFTSKLNGGQVKAVVETLVGTSSQVSSSAPGNVYKNMNIYVDTKLGADVIGNSKINFKVEKSWTDDNKFDLSTITLFRYSSGAWDQLPTEMTGEDESYYYFTSTTPGFSPFAISSIDPSLIAEESTAEEAVSSSSDTEDMVMSTEDAVSVESTTDTSQESRSTLPFMYIIALVGLVFIGAFGYKGRFYYEKLYMQIGNPDGKRYRRIKK
ncbi:PGF-pre-PGF domain-containing protein [Methanolobus mangrovi]|uniref:PGF-pre-PGF domain-containing protein n=1 Tax=Methanolobus mangrovi TaxID=3072977 RepID=A0AA51UGG9_9EURY|nr:PGF-pre-PGF domain-containing protein [Methanolobus mangrovi]WMW21266.1 PGF-pre-PGF domain-containing protein [Methanolobus mangrovi]